MGALVVIGSVQEQRGQFDNNVRTKYEDLVQDGTVQQAVEAMLASEAWRADFLALIEIGIEAIKHTDEELKNSVAEIRKYQEADAE